MQTEIIYSVNKIQIKANIANCKYQTLFTVRINSFAPIQKIMYDQNNSQKSNLRVVWYATQIIYNCIYIMHNVSYNNKLISYP